MPERARRLSLFRLVFSLRPHSGFRVGLWLRGLALIDRAPAKEETRALGKDHGAGLLPTDVVDGSGPVPPHQPARAETPAPAASVTDQVYHLLLGQHEPAAKEKWTAFRLHIEPP